MSDLCDEYHIQPSLFYLRPVLKFLQALMAKLRLYLTLWYDSLTISDNVMLA